MATTYGVEILKKGLKIKLNGQPCNIVDYNFMKPGKGQAVYRCRIKNMITGKAYEKTWRSGENFEIADLERTTVNFSYIDGEDFVFIDAASYEEVRLNDVQVGEGKNWLEDDMECELLYFEGSPIELSLPNFVIKKVAYTEPGVRGDTANNVTKPAKLDTGHEVQVPIFINEGDLLKIDTRDGKYVERVKA